MPISSMRYSYRLSRVFHLTPARKQAGAHAVPQQKLHDEIFTIFPATFLIASCSNERNRQY